MTSRRRLSILLIALAVAASACGGPILANPAAPTAGIPARTPAPEPPDDPQPIVLPRDDGPHERLTEWWYYTGHLVDEDGGTWGFEYVIFRAERGSFPISWAAHFALTDETAGTFTYAQRSAVGPQVDRSPRGPDGEPTGFDLSVVDLGAPPTPAGNPAWTMTGGAGTDRLTAVAGVAEPLSAPGGRTIALDLQVRTDRPVALHDTDGWIPFGPAGGSYYYSRTRMDATGTLRVGDRELTVTGIAWFDHQWGDFISVGGGGWDWFALNLDDGTDLTVSVVLDRERRPVLTYATIVDPDGTARHVSGDAIAVEALGTWTSPLTGATYPSGWTLEIASEQLALQLQPTVLDQELDTRATTGVIYWEGSQRVTGTHRGVPVTGRGYVELTGYAD